MIGRQKLKWAMIGALTSTILVCAGIAVLFATVPVLRTLNCSLVIGK